VEAGVNRSPATAAALNTSAVRFVDQTRGPGLGASMAGACLGVSPYCSPIGAWLKLKGRAQDTSGPQAEWGNILEPVIRGYYAARHRVEIHVPTESLYHPQHPWLRATPDGMIAALDRNVQCKCVCERLSWHWGLNPRNRSAPPHYRVQAVVEMAVTGVSRTDFAVLCGGNDYFEVIVERDLELEAAIVERLAAFWASLERDEPPPLDDADEWRAYFADRRPKQKVQTIAPSSMEAILDTWKAAREAAKAAAKAEALAKNQIMAIAAQEQATAYESKHGRVLVIQAEGKNPYIKAPSDWAEEDIAS
jgi:putative phage-type endonuclease